jgi:hypothetical protein
VIIPGPVPWPESIASTFSMPSSSRAHTSVLKASTRRPASGGIWAVFEVSSQGSSSGVQRSGSRYQTHKYYQSDKLVFYELKVRIIVFYVANSFFA